MPTTRTPRHSPQTSDQRIVTLAIATIAVAFIVMGIKYVAYLYSGSVALYSDALESIVNVMTAIAALVAIKIAARPPDDDHPFGHHKAEFFSAIFEGAMIIVAAIAILIKAVGAIVTPTPLELSAFAIAINTAASALNFAWGMLLLNRGRAWRSAALSADAQHLFTDVVTSLGVIVGLIAVAVTGWTILDPLLAIAVALHILWTGHQITLQSMSRLLDQAADPDIQTRIRAIISDKGDGALEAHDIRTRQAGRALFIEFHLVVPGTMSVDDAHAICDRLEDAIEADVEGSEVVIHVEPDHKAKPHRDDTVKF